MEKNRSEVAMLFRVGTIGPEVEKFQRGLCAIGYHTGPIDGHYGEATESAVIRFQKDTGLYVDGVAGRTTLGKYNYILSTLQSLVPAALESMGINPVEDFKVGIAPPPLRSQPKSSKFEWKKCPADKVKLFAGYGYLRLREDVAKKYMDLYHEVHTLGGVITTAGGRRSIASKSSPSRSRTSLHYLGRAFDLALPTGMHNVKRDPYIIVRDYDSPGARKWTVWCRTDDESVPEVELDASTVSSYKNAKGRRYTQLHSKRVTCRAFNFTKLAKKNGFFPVSARRSFFKGGPYTGAEWWHFSYLPGLTMGTTTFGSELLCVYPLEKCQKFVYWDEVKDYIYGKDWF